VRAVVYDRYGPPEVQRLEDVKRPIPQDDEVLVKVHATTVTRTDCGIRAGKPFFVRFIFGFPRPKQRILGTELAGEVAAVGAAVSKFAVGEHVFGSTAAFKSGSHAEFVCVSEAGPIALKPAVMTFVDAAGVTDGAVLALMCVESVHLLSGQAILVYGASGAIGTAGVQLARHFGADVTAVCGTKNIELVRSLGADRVIDYTQEDFTNSGQKYDVIFDAVGKLSFGRCKGSLKRGGAYVATDGLGNIFLALWTSRFGDKRVLFPVPPHYTKETVLLIKELIEAGRFRAVIDRCYPLEDVVEATRYVETEQKTGNVVLTVV
jgi:NADPH:quinone reductase-like Zn-dependent oxidoreductase